jgi:hypothetical protein
MQELLSTMIGRRIDVFCGATSSMRGEVIKVDGGVLHLKDEDGETCYIAIEKIIAVWEKHDKDHHAGFVSKS